MALDTDEGVENDTLAIPFFLWGALNVGPVLIAAFLGSYIEVRVYCVVVYNSIYVINNALCTENF